MTPRQKKPRTHDLSFGEYIRKLRLEKFPDLSGRKFAKEVGITGPYLSNIELGKVPPPSAERVIAIAEKLGVDKQKLLSKAGHIDPEFASIFKDVPADAFPLAMMFNKLMAMQGLEFDFRDLTALLFGRSLEKGEELTREEVMLVLLELLASSEQGKGMPESLQASIDKGNALIQEKIAESKTDKVDGDEQGTV